MAESEQAFATLEPALSPGRMTVRDSDLTLPAGPVRHALDSSGRRHLLVPLAMGDAAVVDRTSRGVTLSTLPRVLDQVDRQVDVACEEHHLHDLFAVVCDDLMDALSAGGSPGPTCQQVLDRWRDLLGPVDERLLGAAALAGLLAELHWLERLAASDPAGALDLWTGPAKERADFTASTGAVEVKATTLRDRVAVEIHGIRQLDPPLGGTLHLYVEVLERAPGADTVPGAVARLREAGVPAARLQRGLRDSGYREQHATAYRTVGFRVLERRLYEVAAGFPRLVESSLFDQMSRQRIHNVRYSLDLSVRPPDPLSIDELDHVAATLLSSGPAR